MWKNDGDIRWFKYMFFKLLKFKFSMLVSLHWAQYQKSCWQNYTSTREIKSDLVICITNCTQYSIKTYIGEESEKEWIYV